MSDSPLLATSGCSRYHGLTEAEAEQLIAIEVPLGSDARKVFSFLDGRGLEHSAVVALPAETLARPGSDSFFWSSKLDGKRERIRSYVSAKIPDVGGQGFFTTWDVLLRFYFDQEGKVVAHQAEKIGTSL